MYIPEAFREDRPEAIHDFLGANSFGILVTDREGLSASHLPFLLDTARGPQGTLMAHMARANPQWKSLRPDVEVLVVFQGPHAYVSPSWYETELSVPTWNYGAVHAYGLPRLVESEAALLRILEATVQIYEAPLPEPWTLQRLPREFIEKLTRAIVGFEVEIVRLEGKLKLSQNRPEADRRKAAAALSDRPDAMSQAVGEWMREMDSQV